MLNERTNMYNIDKDKIFSKQRKEVNKKGRPVTGGKSHLKIKTNFIHFLSGGGLWKQKSLVQK